jgi:hypothetical protein
VLVVEGEGERLRATGARSTERPAREGRAGLSVFVELRHGGLRQCSLSRNFSASSAAMQPKPAEVIACR